MTEMIFTSPMPTLLNVTNDDKYFPVHRVYCVGRNYSDHAREMGHDPARETPFFFQKNYDDLQVDGTFAYPTGSDNVQHEVELMVALKSGGKNLTLTEAQASIFGYASCLDMTKRDLQATLKQKGQPWEIAKAFEHSMPCSSITPAFQCGDMANGTIKLYKNNQLQQSGHLNDMIWSIPEIIAILSTYFTLKAGDLIATGTPSGVSGVKKGDVLRAEIENLPNFTVKVT